MSTGSSVVGTRMYRGFECLEVSQYATNLFTALRSSVLLSAQKNELEFDKKTEISNKSYFPPVGFKHFSSSAAKRLADGTMILNDGVTNLNGASNFQLGTKKTAVFVRARVHILC